MATQLNEYGKNYSDESELREWMSSFWSSRRISPTKFHYYTDGQYMSLSGTVSRDVECSCTLTPHVAKVVRYCHNCGEEMYGLWGFASLIFDKVHPDAPNTYHRLTDASREMQFSVRRKSIEKIGKMTSEGKKLSSMQECPICGGRLSAEPGYLMSYWNGPLNFCKERINVPDDYDVNCSIEEDFAALEKIRNEKINRQVDSQILELSSRIDIQVADQNDLALKSSIMEKNSELNAYVSHVLTLESGVYELSQRLKMLYTARIPVLAQAELGKLQAEEPYLKKRRAMAVEMAQPQTCSLENEINKLEKELARLQDEKTRVSKELASKPVFVGCSMKEPTMPEAPVLSKPGLFNRKKVMQLNNMLTETYQQKLAEYQAEMTRYKEEIAKTNAKNDAIQKTHDARMEDLKHRQDELLTKIEVLEEKICSMEEEIEKVISETEKQVVLQRELSPQEKKLELLEQEIETAEALLAKFYEQRNKMYSYGVVFPKYRSMVAIASFSEYLITGRCSKLEGADGCYNLYETECKANMVIAQLNRVVESLEQIKDNQFTIYSVLRSAEGNLHTINQAMNKALDALNVVAANSEEIKRPLNTMSVSSVITAYQTQQAAYYAKKNADLTNSLGFLIALK